MKNVGKGANVKWFKGNKQIFTPNLRWKCHGVYQKEDFFVGFQVGKMQGHGVDLEMKICLPINILRQCTFFAGVLLAASHVGFSQGPPTPVKASPASCAYIWQGFSQSWGYNHRIHRFADCIETDLETPCKFQMMHAAASGSGSGGPIPRPA